MYALVEYKGKQYKAEKDVLLQVDKLDAEKALTETLMEHIDKYEIEKKENVLVYVKPVCINNDGTYEYDFFFSNTPEYTWGPDWDIDTPSVNGDLTPDSTTYNKIRRVKTTLPLKTAEETSCFSMEYTTYGILALSWIDIENLEKYPEHGRLTLHFGETESTIEEKLAMYDWKMARKNLKNDGNH